MSGRALVVTCEHGGNRIPARYGHLFAGPRARSTLQGHRGYDPGALRLARTVAQRLGAPLLSTTISRLLIDLNRSPGHPQLFSGFVAELGPEERARLIARYLLPHRRAVEAEIDDRLRTHGRVLHVAVHSFTSRLQGRTRNADVGLLYDTRRAPELELARTWQARLRALDPGLRVRRNYPYNGASDGLTRYLRGCYRPRDYAGLELEVNQALLGSDPAAIARSVCESLRSLR